MSVLPRNKYTEQEILNACFDETNNALNIGGGTVTGNMTITGNLTVNGSFTFGDAVTDILTVTGKLRFADGTVSLPAISPTSDTNSGFYVIGADNIGLALNGVVAVNWATTGTTFSTPAIFSTGVAVVGTNYSMGRDADATNLLHFNVPTGSGFEMSINDTAYFSVSATNGVLAPSVISWGGGTGAMNFYGTAVGEMPANTNMYGSTSVSTFLITGLGAAGWTSKTGIAYLGIAGSGAGASNYKSGLEIANTQYGRGNMELMKTGGEITVGGVAKLTPQERTAEVILASAATAGGLVDNGTHSYKVTFVTPEGESLSAGKSAVITAGSGNNTIPLTGISLGSSRVTARKVYRTVAGDTGAWKLLTTISNNSTTTFSDTIADASLGADIPTVNTTSNVWKHTVTDSATAIGVVNDTSAALSTAGSKLVSWKNNGTEKAAIGYDGKADFSTGSVRVKRSVADIANPAVPTDAELDATFGDPTVVGSGFIGILDDNDAGTGMTFCTTTGTAGEWFFVAMTKAI